jgi:hypothetical protein
MLSLIIADKSFAVRERSLLSRLEVGLADEGVRVIHAAPVQATVESGTGLGLQSTIVPFEQPAVPMLTRPSRRAAKLLGAIAAADGEAPTIDVVHAFGAGCWSLAMEVGRATGAGVLLEVFRPGLVAAAVDVLDSVHRGQAPPAFLTSEPAVAAALGKRARQARVYSAPWGVHAPSELRGASPLDRPPSIAVLFDSGEPKPVAACLGGIVSAGPRIAEALIELGVSDASSTREGRLWAAIRKAGLVDRASILSDMEARREPVLDMDLLLLPEPGGWERTMVLEAMANGMGIVAVADSALECIEDGTTAKVVRGNTQAAWAAAIRELLEKPQVLADLRASAHAYVRSHRPASAHVEAVLKAYRLMAGVAV